MTATIVAYNIEDLDTLSNISSHKSIFVSSKINQEVIEAYNKGNNLSDINLLNACLKEQSFDNDVIVIDRQLRIINNNWYDIINEQALSNKHVDILGQKYSIMKQTELNILPKDFSFAKLLFNMNLTNKHGNFFYFVFPSIIYIKKEIIQKIGGFDPDLGFSPVGMADFCLRAYCYHERYTGLIDDNLAYHSPSNSMANIDLLKNKYKTDGEDIHKVCKNVVSLKILTI